jgi:hypothetical protein
MPDTAEKAKVTKRRPRPENFPEYEGSSALSSAMLGAMSHIPSAEHPQELEPGEGMESSLKGLFLVT